MGIVRIGQGVFVYKEVYDCSYYPGSEAMHQRVLLCDISNITNHSTDIIYLSVLGRISIRYHLSKKSKE